MERARDERDTSLARSCNPRYLGRARDDGSSDPDRYATGYARGGRAGGQLAGGLSQIRALG